MVKNCFAVLLLLLLFSCASKKDIVYFQDINALSSEAKNYEPTIKSDDVLLIFVSSSTPELAKDFNLLSMGTMEKGSDIATTQMRFQTYLVNNKGEIDFPVIGTIKIGGLTRSQAMDKMKGELKKYINDPIVNLRITNYKVSVFGEVTRPGQFSLVSERVTLPEALSMAGDLTVYGDRKNVLIIREIEGVKTYNYIDLTKASLFDSPFYYLSQNDVIYVSPNQTKVNSSAVGPNTTVIISSVSLLITLVALIIR
jgi:polysaccharide biosynthesis/export protein